MGSNISRSTDHHEGVASYEQYRQKANEYAVKRGKCFEESRAAYQRGDAKELSNKGKEYGRLMEQYNEMAKNAAFSDLHGLHVKEALAVTRKRLDQFIRNKEDNLIIIVGKGNRSVDGIARIKPEVIKMMQEYKVKATPNKPNEGCIYVEPISHPGDEPDFSWIDSFFAPLLRRLIRYLKSRR
ncbi:hypothetical protein BGW41_003819 [Actinomortierella wolfii]|nr:hypothetical protein BGW41_003819 [Actinomortierella wolfii]